jgi:hypothetical protein
MLMKISLPGKTTRYFSLLILFMGMLSSLLPLDAFAAFRNSLVGDPNFKVSNLPPDAQLWYKRIQGSIARREYQARGWPSTPDEWARSGDAYLIGRPLNTHITGLLLTFRQTGDLKILDEVDRLMQMCRAQLRDEYGAGKFKGQKDGYLNWRFTYAPGTTDKIRGTDNGRELDEVLSASVAATCGYAFHVNRHLKSPSGVNYGERADFWKTYLTKHWEPKWRKRNRKPSGFPFMKAGLFHIFTNQIRTMHYMGKLTGNSAYTKEAERLAAIWLKNMIITKTPAGDAYMWGHSVAFDVTRETNPGNAQMTVYLIKTYSAALDMHFDGFAHFAHEGHMKLLMMNFREIILDGKSTSLPLARGTAGEGIRTGIRLGDRKTISLRPTMGNDHKYVRKEISAWSNNLFPILTRWDNTSKLEKFTLKAYNEVEKRRLEKPREIGTPVAMFHLAMVRKYGSGGGSTTPPPPPPPAPTPTITVPKAPSLLTAAALSTTQIKIQWRDNAGNESGHKIEISKDGGKSYSQIGITGANIKAFTAANLKASTKYYFRVRASNSAGNSAYSNIASATTKAAVVVNKSPSVKLAIGQSPDLVAPGVVNLIATASDSDGKVTKVEFYNGSKLISADLTAPFSEKWSNIPAGTYSLTAKAYDDKGASTVSAKVSLTIKSAPLANKAPVVTITYPTSAVSPVAPANLTIQATATDSDGLVTKVEFFDNGTLLGSDSTAPYSLAWKEIEAGTHRLTAKAFDNKGASTTSSSVTFTVKEAPVAESKTALLVTDSLNLRPSDNLVKQRLESLGFQIMVALDSTVQPSHTEGKQLVVISSNSASTKIGSRLRDVTVPILCWEPYLYDDLGMTGSVATVDYNWITSQTAIHINGTSSPLAGGMHSLQTVYNAAESMTYGVPAQGAHVIATVNNQACIFKYRKGGQMVGMSAPAPRVGFFMGNEGPSALNTNGWKLFDAAVKWAAEN